MVTLKTSIEEKSDSGGEILTQQVNGNEFAEGVEVQVQQLSPYEKEDVDYIQEMIDSNPYDYFVTDEFQPIY